LKLIFEVSDAPLPNRLSAGVPATDGRSGAIWTHARRAGAPIGTGAKLWPELGYGFVLGGDGREIYFHRNSVADDAFERLAIGARVAYSEEDGADGPQASRLTLLGS
jgi:cold shock CspA family protein